MRDRIVLYTLNGVDMIALKSSSVRAAGYDELTKTLYVEFTTGATYKYEYVPREVYFDFIKSKSPGKFVNRVLTPMFFYKSTSGAPLDKRGKSPYELSEEESEANEERIEKMLIELKNYQAKIYDEFDNPQEAEDHCTQVLVKVFGSSEREARRQVRNINELLKLDKEGY